MWIKLYPSDVTPNNLFAGSEFGKIAGKGIMVYVKRNFGESPWRIAFRTYLAYDLSECGFFCEVYKP